MLSEMRPSELGTWAALYAADPWGENRADLRAGIVASVIANVHRDARRQAEPFTPRDFMPYAKAPPAKSLPNLIRAWFAPFVVKKKR